MYHATKTRPTEMKIEKEEHRQAILDQMDELRGRLLNFQEELDALDGFYPLEGPQEAVGREVIRVQRMALLARPYMPKQSFYRKWMEELNEKEMLMPAWKFAKLRNRLSRVQGEGTV